MTRASLANRRISEIFSFRHNGVPFTGQVSYGAEGEPIEVFLDGGRIGSAIQAVARDTAVAASLALQHGTPIDMLRRALTRNDDGSPAGALGALLDLFCEATC